MRRAIPILIVFVSLALAAPALAETERGVKFHGLGPRVGFSIDPNQLVLGAHAVQPAKGKGKKAAEAAPAGKGAKGAKAVKAPKAAASAKSKKGAKGAADKSTSKSGAGRGKKKAAAAKSS